MLTGIRALVSGVLAVTACQLSVRATAPSMPNIVVIMVDDMGYGDPGCYNADSKIRTPHIDSLARDGLRFTDAHAPGPLCHLSRYGLLTGRYPFRGNPGSWSTKASITEEQATIASFLKSVGYRTAMVGKWHLGFDEQGYDRPLPGGPVDRGFDSFFGIRASTDIPPYFYIRDRHAVQPPTESIGASHSAEWSPIQGAFWRAGGISPDLSLKDVLPRFTAEAISVIQAHAERPSESRAPLMLYLAYPAPHTPWLPAREFVGQSGAGMYGDFAMMVDSQIGLVLEALKKAGMSENTLLVFTSDNGPVWYDADVARFGHDSSGGLRGMKSDAWECGHRMPFVIRWPGRIVAGATTSRTISFVDLFATLADVLHQPLPPAAAPDSFSFATELLDTSASAQAHRETLPLKSGGGFMTIRSGDWKLIRGLGSGGFSEPRRIKAKPGQPPGQLYNLKEDPAEQDNLYAERPEIVARLAEILEKIEAAEGHRFLE